MRHLKPTGSVLLRMQVKGKFKAEDQQLVGETWAWREKVQRSMDGEADNKQSNPVLACEWLHPPDSGQAFNEMFGPI